MTKRRKRKPANIESAPPSANKPSTENIGDFIASFEPYLRVVAARAFGSRLRTKAGSDDLVQETMLHAWEHFAQFRGRTRSEFRAWLRRILLNECYRAQRRLFSKGQPNLVEMSREIENALKQMATRPEDMPLHVASNAEERQSLLTAISKLPVDYQTVVRLRVWHERSFDEIGKVLNRSEDAARKIWRRAIAALASLLSDPNADAR